MTTSVQLSAEQKKGIVMVERTCIERVFTILSIVRPGRLRWVGPLLPRLPLEWQDLWREMRPRRIRWGWTLLLAVAFVLMWGECGPAAGAAALLP